MMELAPDGYRCAQRDSAGPGTAATSSERRKRVILLAGCAQQVLRPDINDATIRLLARRGVDVEVAPTAPAAAARSCTIMGREDEAHGECATPQCRSPGSEELASNGIDAIIVNASGCGTTVKDYGHMLRNDPEYAERAARSRASPRTSRSFSPATSSAPPERWSSLRVAYHSACSMQHGQRIIDDPRLLLRHAGFSVVDIPEGHICCGSAGTYNILQPEIAGELQGPQGQAAPLHPCRRHRSRQHRLHHAPGIGIDVPIVHTVELLDWAYGGPVPAGLEALRGFITDVPRPKRPVEAYIEA